jgi:dienelactone hydrolase
MNFRHHSFVHFLVGIAVAVLAAIPAATALAEVSVKEIRIPMTVKGVFTDSHLELTATEYRPDGDGPFPLLLINHGTPRSQADLPKVKNFYAWQAQHFARRGFVVINALRRGYGGSDGPWAEGYSSCTHPDYLAAGLETARDIGAVVEYGRAQSYVDASRVVLLGHSAGGFGALALSSQNPPGVIATISFAGGRGSRGPDSVCNEATLVAAFERYAGTTRVPMLWFYAENDHYFGPALAKRLGAVYQAQGVDLDLQIVPASGEDGHGFFMARSNLPVWGPAVEAFLNKLAVPLRPR